MKKLKLTLVAFIFFQHVFAQEVDGDLKALIQKSFAYFPRLKELEQRVAALDGLQAKRRKKMKNEDA